MEIGGSENLRLLEEGSGLLGWQETATPGVFEYDRLCQGKLWAQAGGPARDPWPWKVWLCVLGTHIAEGSAEDVGEAWRRLEGALPRCWYAWLCEQTLEWAGGGYRTPLEARHLRCEAAARGGE